MSDKRAAAVALARRGFRVFPLQPNGKRPYGEGWTETATSDPEEVHRLWSDPVMDWPRDFNIGVLTNEHIVVDVDEKEGRDGTASFLALDYPLDTLVVRTPTGGLHVYYTGPNKSLSAGRLGSGLDIRSYHGYVVGPGSEIDGVAYEIDNDAPLLYAPADLIARLDEPQERRTRLAVAELDTPAVISQAHAYLEQDAPLAIEGLRGDDTTFGVACALKDMGLSEANALDMMAVYWNDRCAPPWELDELEQKVANAYSYGKRAPGEQSAEHDFVSVDVEGLAEFAAERPRPKPLGLAGWMRYGDPVVAAEESWLFYDLLPASGVACVTGPSGAGKTFVLLRLARCVAAGEPFCGVRPDDSGAVLILYTGSEGSGFKTRKEALKEDPDEDLPIFARQIGPLNVTGALTKLAEEIKVASAEIEMSYGVPVRLIILETLSASGLLEDENDNGAAAVAMGHLNTLSAVTGALVAFSHHPPKEGKGTRGAGAIRNNVDVVIEATREGISPVRGLVLTKARNSQERSLGSYTLIPVTLPGVVDAKGRPVKSMVAHIAEAPVKELEEHKQWPLLAECIDIEFEEPTVLPSGRKAVRADLVRELFFDRYDGSKGPSNRKKLWTRLVASVTQRGLLDVVLENGHEYFAPVFTED